MRYIISDIHGCFQEYQALLEKIGFSHRDELYVLGDAMDRGPEPIRVMQDLMARSNVYYVVGNHDYTMLAIMRALDVELTEASAEKLTPETLSAYFTWTADGGAVTATQYLKLSQEERADILDYLEDAPAYDTIEHDGRLYVLTHAGIRGFDPEKELEDYAPADFLWERADYSRRYFPGNRIFLVTGHTPTMLIRQDEQPLVYQKHGHIAVDCGCVFGGNLAAYCVETGEVFYVPRNSP